MCVELIHAFGILGAARSSGEVNLLKDENVPQVHERNRTAGHKCGKSSRVPQPGPKKQTASQICRFKGGKYGFVMVWL